MLREEGGSLSAVSFQLDAKTITRYLTADLRRLTQIIGWPFWPEISLGAECSWQPFTDYGPLTTGLRTDRERQGQSIHQY